MLNEAISEEKFNEKKKNLLIGTFFFWRFAGGWSRPKGWHLRNGGQKWEVTPLELNGNGKAEPGSWLAATDWHGERRQPTMISKTRKLHGGGWIECQWIGPFWGGWSTWTFEKGRPANRKSFDFGDILRPNWIDKQRDNWNRGYVIHVWVLEQKIECYKICSKQRLNYLKIVYFTRKMFTLWFVIILQKKNS